MSGIGMSGRNGRGGGRNGFGEKVGDGGDTFMARLKISGSVGKRLEMSGSFRDTELQKIGGKCVSSHGRSKDHVLGQMRNPHI